MKRKKKNLLIEGITFGGIIVSAFNATVGFFVYKMWEIIWKRWNKKDSSGSNE